MRKPLTYSIIPWTESDGGMTGFLLSIRDPYTGQRGQGFYLQEEDAVRAYHRALHRLNSGDNPCAYLDAPAAKTQGGAA